MSSSGMQPHRQQDNFEFLPEVPEFSDSHQNEGSTCDAKDAEQALDETPRQLIEQVAMTSQRWTQMREQLQGQRTKLEALRDVIFAVSKDNKDNKKMDQGADSIVSLETERARHRNELRELQQRHQVAMDTERARFLARLEELEQLQKRLARQEEFNKVQLQEDVASEELHNAKAELENEREAGRQANERIRQLQAEILEAKACRTKWEAENSDLKKRLQELTEKVSLENAERFKSMAARNLSLLDELESRKRQLLEVRDEDWNLVPPAVEGDATNLRQLQEEVTRLRQREAELLQRCTDNDRMVDDVIREAEQERSRLKLELTQLQASQREVSADYAEKMKLKARTELQLRERIDDLTRKLAEFQSQHRATLAKPR